MVFHLKIVTWMESCLIGTHTTSYIYVTYMPLDLKGLGLVKL